MYKPLSQAWSEGEESEEESRATKNNLPQQPKAAAQSMVSSLKTEFPAGTYSTAGGVESLYACSTAIPVEGSPAKAEEVRPLTLKRKIALTISILNCIAFAVVFMWILPCDKDTCKAKPAAYEWKRSFPNLSFSGLSHVNNNKNKTIVIASYEVQGSCEAVYCQGLLALDSRKGAELWKVTVPKPIRTVDCQLTASGGCLVSLKTGGLIAFNSHEGDLVWQMHQHAGDDSPGLISDMDISNVIALSDLNTDNVNDLAVFSGSALTFVSGKSGRILGSAVNFTDCLDLTSPMFNNTHIVLHCSQEARSILQAIPLQDLYSASQVNSTVQWMSNGVASTTSNSTSILMEFGNYSVASQNQGNCPQCEAILILRKANITLFEKNWKQTLLQPLKSFSLQEGSLGMLFPLQTWACSDPTGLKWYKRERMFLAVLQEYHVETEELNIQFTYPLVDVSVGPRGPQLFYGDGATLNSHILTPDIEKFVENTA